MAKKPPDSESGPLAALIARPELAKWLAAPAWLARREAPEVEWLERNLATHLTLGTVLSGDTSGLKPPWNEIRIPRRAQAACALFLRSRAEDLARAEEREAERLARRVRPEHPRLAEVWDRLSALRDAIRPQTGPALGLRVSTRLETELEFSIQCRVWGYHWCEHSAEAAPAEDHLDRVTVELDERALPTRLRCARQGSDEAPCLMVISALEDLLDLFGDPDDVRDDTLDRMRDHLGFRPWERELATVNDALARLEPAARTWSGLEVQLGWRLSQPWSAPEVVPVEVRPKKRGAGFVAREIEVEDALYSSLARLPADREALENTAVANGGHTYLLLRDRSEYVARALLALVGHPRVFLEHRGATLVQVRRGRWALEVDTGAEQGFTVSVRDELGQRVTPEEAVKRFYYSDSWHIHETVACHVDVEAREVIVTPISEGLRRLILAFAQGSTFPSAAREPLADLVSRMAQHAPVVVSGALSGQQRSADARVIVYLELDGGQGLNVAFRCQPLAGAVEQHPGEGPPTLYVPEEGRLTRVERDLEGEARRARELARELRLEPPTAVQWLIETQEEALALVHALSLRPELEVKWGGSRRLRVGDAQAGELVIRAKQRRLWFGLAGSLSTEAGEVPLHALLAAIARGSRFVRVEGDAWVRLDEALRETLAPAAHVVELSGAAGLKASRWAVPVIDALGEEGVRIEAPEAWAGLLTRMRAAEGLEISLPEGFEGELRPYQREGFEWMCRLSHWGAGGILADDMGLGKTIQALALLLARAERGPALVVAPTSVGFNWMRECGRFAPGLRPRLFRGRGHEDMLRGLSPGDLLITSYDLVKRYAEQLDETFATLVLDEAQAIKNPSTHRARAIRGLDAEVCFALTGTPLENRTGELWSIFSVVAPGLLGSKARFRERFARPIEADGDAAVRQRLARIVKPFILRRLKSEVARELPPRTESVIEVELHPGVRARYEQLRRAAAAEMAKFSGPPEVKRLQMLTALTRLRQLACHPRLLDPKTELPSAKLEALRELVAELRAEGHRALVFSQFTGLLALVREALEADGVSYAYLDGSTPEKRRREAVDAFQAGEGDVFLLSLKAGGVGLNLTGATYVVHLDPWWNPAVEDQATDRAHRIGQESPVTVYRIIARGTVEETILELQADKRDLVDSLLAGTAGAGRLTTEELLALIRGSADQSLIEDREWAEPL